MRTLYFFFSSPRILFSFFFEPNFFCPVLILLLSVLIYPLLILFLCVSLSPICMVTTHGYIVQSSDLFLSFLTAWAAMREWTYQPDGSDMILVDGINYCLRNRDGSWRDVADMSTNSEAVEYVDWCWGSREKQITMSGRAEGCATRYSNVRYISIRYSGPELRRQLKSYLVRLWAAIDTVAQLCCFRI